jgi:hypothetical protein
VAALARKVWLALAVLIVALGLFLLSRDVVLDWDRFQIETERARRLVYALKGVPLPGTPDLDDLSGRLAAHGLALLYSYQIRPHRFPL